MLKYRELIVGNLRNRGFLYTTDELKSEITNLLNSKTDYYTSIFYFNEEIVKYFQQNGSIKGFNGNIGVDDIVFDIDIGKNSDDYVLEKAREFVKELIFKWDLSEKEIDIWYSGRGYHIYINDYFKFGFGNIIKTVKNTIKEHFPQLDNSIYKTTGVIRGKYSYNSKSGRYKIPLEYKELFSLSSAEIIELSKNPNKEYVSTRSEFERDLSSFKVFNNVEVNISSLDDPTRIVTCMQKLYLRGQVIGRRNTDILRLASAWRRQGLHKQATFNLLRMWANTLDENSISNVVDRVYDKGYRFGCNDYVMSEFCDPKCIYFTHKNYDSKVIRGTDAITDVRSYLDFIKTSKYVSLTNALGLEMEVNIYPGEYMVAFGDTKLGKSTIINNIVLKNKHLRWLLLPLENGIPLEIKRLIQIENHCDEAEAIELIKSNSDKLNFLDSFNFYDKSITLEDLRKFIIDSDVEAIVIDTIDQISVKKEDYTSKTEYLANGIRELANSLKRIFILVHHISKSSVEDANNKRKDLTIHSGKGSSAIEQKANYVITIEGERNSQYRLIKAQGGRDKELFEITTEYNPVTKKIRRI